MVSGISDKLLRDARKARKLSLAEVAEYAGISEARFRLLEAGEAEPTLNQLQKLSELYNVAPYSLFGDQPITFDDGLPDFRKATLTDAKVSPRGLTRIWSIQRQSKFVAQLLESLGQNAPKPKSLGRITNRDRPDPETLRASFDEWRSRVQVKLKLQQNSEDLFFSHIRLFADVHACNSVMNSAPEGDYLGFYSEDLGASSIFVNREIKFTRRRIFTICHEFAHYIYDAEGISDPFLAENEVEKTCNRYAAKFIAPDKVVQKLLERSSGQDAVGLVNKLSSETFLSKQAAALRLVDLGHIEKRSLKIFFGHSHPSKTDGEFESQKTGTPMGRGAAIGKKLSEIGVYNAYVAACALKAKLIDRFDVAQAFGLSDNLQSSVLELAERRFEAGAD